MYIANIYSAVWVGYISEVKFFVSKFRITNKYWFEVLVLYLSIFICATLFFHSDEFKGKFCPFYLNNIFFFKLWIVDCLAMTGIYPSDIAAVL